MDLQNHFRNLHQEKHGSDRNPYRCDNNCKEISGKIKNKTFKQFKNYEQHLLDEHRIELVIEEMSTDKMSTNKMSTNKVSTDKVSMEKMSTGKLSTSQMIEIMSKDKVKNRKGEKISKANFIFESTLLLHS